MELFVNYKEITLNSIKSDFHLGLIPKNKKLNKTQMGYTWKYTIERLI